MDDLGEGKEGGEYGCAVIVEGGLVGDGELVDGWKVLIRVWNKDLSMVH